MKVFVYYNSHKRCFSIKALDGPNKNRVIQHASKIVLREATFQVSEAGRQRALRTGVKQVHAGVVGEIECFEIAPNGNLDDNEITPLSQWRRFGGEIYLKAAKRIGEQFGYSPKLSPSFCDMRGQPIASKGSVVMIAANKPSDACFTFDPTDMTEEESRLVTV